MAKNDPTPNAETVAKGKAASLPLPTIETVALDAIPARAEASGADAEYRTAVLAVLASGNAAKGGGYATRDAAELGARRVARLVRSAAPEGQQARTVIASDGDGFAWYLRWGEPRKGGRQPKNAANG